MLLKKGPVQLAVKLKQRYLLSGVKLKIPIVSVKYLIVILLLHSLSVEA